MESISDKVLNVRQNYVANVEREMTVTVWCLGSGEKSRIGNHDERWLALSAESRRQD